VSKDRFKIFRWLAGLVTLLLIPSVLLAGLWVSDAITEVRGVDRALQGLVAIEALHPVVRSRTENKFTETARDWLVYAETLSGDPETIKSARQLYLQAAGDFSDAKSILAARQLVRLIARTVNLNATTPTDIAGLPNLVTHQSLAVSQRAMQTMSVVRRLSARQQLNAWDRMALPVQGGQFKVTADAISRLSRQEFEGLPADDLKLLGPVSESYRSANLAFQQAAGVLVREIITAESGSDLKIEKINAAYPKFASANNALWLAAIKTLRHGLQLRRDGLLTTLIATSVICALSILTALLVSIFVSRAFAARTLREMEDIGFHDPLTGLPNRRALTRMLETLLGKASMADPIVGVLHIDLSRFKAINDEHGELVGDAVLRDVAARLTQRTCHEDVVMRTGGNEFVVVCQRFRSIKRLGAFAERIIEEVSKKRTIGDISIQLDACIGIAGSSGRSLGAEQLLMDAALALRSVKSQGTSGHQMFVPEMRERFENSNAVAGELREAMEKGHIEPWFQPQISLETGLVCGVESLVRWVDPERGLISPGVFLPTAQDVGLMEELDGMLRRKALASAKRFRDAGLGAQHVGLNITAALLGDPDMVDRLSWEVEVAGLTPDLVSIEILESVMIDEAAAAPIKANIARLSALGFFIELDDFGTGHSGLSSLRDLKVNRVKIDRSFVSGIDRNPELATFTNALINLALSLNIEVLAEGVETEAEREWLMHHGCHIIQGFLYAGAMPEHELVAWIDQRQNGDPSQTRQSAA